MHKLRIFQILFFVITLVLANAYAEESAVETQPTISPTATTIELIKVLASSSFDEKQTIIDILASRDDEYLLKIFKSMSSGKLYWSDEKSVPLIYEEKDDVVSYVDAINARTMDEASVSDASKITVNNKLRGLLKRTVAAKSLNHPSVATRLNAIKEIKQDLSEETVELLKKQRDVEKDDSVKNAIVQAIALSELDSGDTEKIISSIHILENSADPSDLSRLRMFTEKDSSGNYSESNAQIRQSAEKSIKAIESRLSYYENVQTVYYGISLGSVLLLSAIGLAITFGVMGVINMAHGELMMLGAYTTYVVQQLMPNSIGMSLVVAIPAAFIVAGLVGIAIERGVIRFLYGRPLETLLATFGISLILQQLARAIFSPLNRTVETPTWMSGALEINASLAFTYNRMAIIVFAVLVFAILVYLLRKTSLGLHVRVVSQNRNMASAMGIRTNRVDMLTFGLGSGIAGVAGVALSQLTNVGPNLGQAYIIDSFMVVVFGGVGNLWGTFVGAMSLGIVNKILEPWSGAVLAKIVVLVGIILFIQKRPRGLFPQRGRVQEV